MSIDLRIYNFTGLSFRRLIDHTDGRATFVGVVTAKETVSKAETETEIDFYTYDAATTRRFHRAIEAFNEAWNLPDEELTEADLDEPLPDSDNNTLIF